jgi:peptidoglycan/LPS O-acetylase OafA/YrhL
MSDPSSSQAGRGDESGEILALTSLRGVAAVYVVLYHFNRWILPDRPVLPDSLFGYGYVAVDIFFVLSGFILATVYWPIVPQQAGMFMLKRICRLYPLHLSVLAVLALAIGLAPWLHVPLHSDQYHAWRALPFVALLVQPFFPGLGGWNNPAWSIGVELLCYLLLPFVLPGVRLASKGWIVGAGLVLAAAQVALLSTAGDAAAGAEAVLRGIYGFYLGVMLRAWMLGRAPVSDRVLTLLQSGALLVVLVGIRIGLPAVVPAASALLIAALSSDRGAIAVALRARPLMWLGHVSFSIYLLHDPIVKTARKLLPLERLQASLHGEMRLTGWLYSAVLLAMILALSALTYRLIEKPGRRIPQRFIRRRTAATQQEVPAGA